MRKRSITRDEARPTLRDVAALAGVSEMTASRALRGVGYVSAETAERIKKTAADLGYVPNRIAGGLASASTNLVGVIIPSMHNVVFPEVLSGISGVLRREALQPVFGVSDYDLIQEEALIRDMLSWRPRGLILAGLEHTDAARRMLEAASVPVVEVMDTDGEAVDLNVGISHHGAGAAMAQTLLTAGRRSIGYVGDDGARDRRAAKRLAGFTDALAAAGQSLAGKALLDVRSSFAAGRRGTAELLASGPIDAIYYANDVLAAGGLMEAQARGVAVPGALALAGFNGLDVIEGLPLRLATVRSPRFEIGRRAAELMLEATDGAPAERLIDLPIEVIPGETI